MNLTFHVGAAIVLFLMGYLLFRLRQQNDLLREMISQSSGMLKEKIEVDWPLSYLKKMAFTLNIEVIFGSGVTAKQVPPLKIKRKIIYDFFLSCAVRNIEVKIDNGVVVYLICDSVANEGEWVNKLEEALGVKCSIKVVEV